MQRLSEQTSSGSTGSPAGGPWSATGRRLLAAGLLFAGAVLMAAGRGERSDRQPSPPSPDALVLVLDPNDAPVEILSALPGVGSSLVGRIVAERRARPFASPADFRRRIPGLGPAALARLAPHLRVEAVGFDEPRRLARAD